MLRIRRLGQEVIGAHPHGLNGLVNAAMTCCHDDRYRKPSRLNLLDQLHAVQLGHSQIGDHDAIGPLQQKGQCLVPVTGQVNLDSQRKLE